MIVVSQSVVSVPLADDTQQVITGTQIVGANANRKGLLIAGTTFSTGFISLNQIFNGLPNPSFAGTYIFGGIPVSFLNGGGGGFGDANWLTQASGGNSVVQPWYCLVPNASIYAGTLVPITVLEAVYVSPVDTSGWKVLDQNTGLVWTQEQWQDMTVKKYKHLDLMLYLRRIKN